MNKNMSKIIFDSGISLDGFFAGDNRSPNNPMGGVSGQIHQWMFKQKSFWKHIKMEGGQEYGADSKLIDDVFARTGSYIMGKRMFEEGEVVWAEDLYEADVYVLTHEKREPWVQKGTTTFYFINDGIESALEKARTAITNKTDEADLIIVNQKLADIQNKIILLAKIKNLFRV